MTEHASPQTLFAVCIDNTDYSASLELRKIYQIIPDAQASQQQLLRVIDESGEDYLFPESCFVLIDLPQTVKEALLKAA
jgi:hypothetical protein